MRRPTRNKLGPYVGGCHSECRPTNTNKKLSYRRETARQLPTSRGGGLDPPAHSPSSGYTYADALSKTDAVLSEVHDQSVSRERRV